MGESCGNRVFLKKEMQKLWGRSKRKIDMSVKQQGQCD